MGMLFDQKTIMEIHDYNIAKSARQQGHQEGRQEGRQEGTLLSLQNLIRNLGLPAEKALAALGVPEAEWPGYTALLQQQ